ncbi:MAG: asparagine synthase-related protein [Gemmatimonadota bacterium]
MSGICGIVNFGSGDVPHARLDLLVQAARFRAVDGCHTWKGNGAALAQLAHFLTLRSAQRSYPHSEPIPDTDDALHLVASARIDNRDELLELLRPKGLIRHDDPADEELILGAYQQWGDGCGSRLIGDFAFAIWDTQRRRLFAARDPMGMRPLYVRMEPAGLIFASEAQQIVGLPGVPQRLHEAAVAGHLAGPFGRTDWSFFEGIEQLSPGHSLVAEAAGVRTWRFWDIDPGNEVRYRREGQYAEHLRQLLWQAVADRLRCARPVGLSLSGGMDSGSIASVAGAQGAQELRTYSWAFDELSGCDERHISGLITDAFSLAATDIPADDAWPLAEYPKHGPHPDDPLLFTYEALADRTLDRARLDGVGVLLSGERGDEMFGDWIYDLAGLLRSGRLRGFIREIAAHKKVYRRSTLGTVRAALFPSAASAPQPFEQPPAWVQPDFAGRTDLQEIARGSAPTPPDVGTVRQARYGRIFMFAGMRRSVALERRRAARGLEYADPWSDRRIAEFIMAVPPHIVTRLSDPKRLLRQAMKGTTPDAALDQAGKIEPVALFHRGFRERAIHTVRDLLTDSRMAAHGFVDPGVLRQAFEAYVDGNPGRHDFWWPLTLEMWLRAYWD